MKIDGCSNILAKLTAPSNPLYLKMCFQKNAWSYSARFVFACLAYCYASFASIAATVEYAGSKHLVLDKYDVADPHGNQNVLRREIRVRGDIDPGDANKITELIDSLDDLEDSGNFYLVLESQGGNIEEAIRIAALIDEMGYGTVVPAHSSCTSACAIIFMAGKEYAAESPPSTFRFLEIPSKLGFHRPRVDLSLKLGPAILADPEIIEQVISEEFKFAYQSSLDVINKILEKRASDWSTDLVVKMLGVGSKQDEFVYAETVGDALEWEIGILNAAPRHQNWGQLAQAIYWSCSNSVPRNVARGFGWVSHFVEGNNPQEQEDFIERVFDAREPEADDRLWRGYDWAFKENSSSSEHALELSLAMEYLNVSGCRVSVSSNWEAYIEPNELDIVDFRDPKNAIRTYPWFRKLNDIVIE